MSLDVSAMATTMIDAARAEVTDRWPQLQAFAEMELRRLAHSLADLAQMLVEGKVTEAHARQLVHMHQIASRSVLLSVEGIALLTAEQVIHAGIRAAAKAVNGIVKFTLL